MVWITFFLSILILSDFCSTQNVPKGLSSKSVANEQDSSPYTNLPEFLTNNPLPQGYPWGSASTSKSDPFSPPNTGVTRTYEFTISRRFQAADGVNKSSILINNQFPGPLIEANWGDTIQVLVKNGLTGPEEGTSMHWHGFTQKSTPWFDGVPSVQQCPISPGTSLTYTFQASQYGTTWYHSHYGSQYMDGSFGPIVVHGPKELPYNVDLGPVLLTDYHHRTSYAYIDAGFEKPPVIHGPDNNLINGRMYYDCSLITPTNGTTCVPNAPISKFAFSTGKTHRLRLINAGVESTQKFSIDNHEMTVIAVDFVPVNPYTTKVVTLGIGQRTDVLVKATGRPTDTAWMRSDIDTACFPLAAQPHALAAVYYPRSDRTSLPNSTATPWQSNNCANDPLSITVPVYATNPTISPAATQLLDIDLTVNATGSLVLTVNNSSFRANYNHPLLLLAKLGNTSYPDDPQWNVYNFGNASSIRLVVRNYAPLPHPMHLHGHNFWVLAEGVGEWDGSIVNPNNPTRRDTHLIPPGSPTLSSYAVYEFETDNPGVWPFHCHIIGHVSGGLYINIMEQPDLITQLPIPATVAQTCRDWAAWTGDNVVDQIDSGL